jgi:hypothetical protein
LVHINSVMSNMVLYMLFFFLFPKGLLNRLDFFHSRFFGRAIVKRKNIDLLSGVSFAAQKTKGD